MRTVLIFVLGIAGVFLLFGKRLFGANLAPVPVTTPVSPTANPYQSVSPNAVPQTAQSNLGYSVGAKIGDSILPGAGQLTGQVGSAIYSSGDSILSGRGSTQDYVNIVMPLGTVGFGGFTVNKALSWGVDAVGDAASTVGNAIGDAASDVGDFIGGLF